MESVPLLEHGGNEERKILACRVWVESKKLWRIVGPAIFQRTVLYSIIVITQAFAGHLGDLELAALSVSTIITGFNFGLFVCEPLMNPIINWLIMFLLLILFSDVLNVGNLIY
jgi:hypothetical protein